MIKLKNFSFDVKQQSLTIVLFIRLITSKQQSADWIRANQYMIFLLNAACLAEKQQIPISYLLVWPDKGSKPWPTALVASTLTITPPNAINSTIHFNKYKKY
jgi:hypothetical protein